MKIIGITGGIGSGKSLVCKIFEQLDVPVFYADAEAKNIINFDPHVRKALTLALGEEIYTSEGLIDKQKISMLIFNSAEKRKIVESIVHPTVLQRFGYWAAHRSDSPYVIKEAALIFESGLTAGLDHIVVVDAPEKLRINRVMERDHVSSEYVKGVILAQLDANEKRKLADFVIVNDGVQMLIPQVLALHNIFSG
jgi:dephospho-CoA kinase